MPNLSKCEIKLVDKSNHHVANADKVTYTLNKAKGEEFPTTANVTIYAVELTDVTALPDLFDIHAVSDDGIVQKRTHILNCSVKKDLGEYVVAVATAPDVNAV